MLHASEPISIHNIEEYVIREFYGISRIFSRKFEPL
jgi:hypothetical protein